MIKMDNSVLAIWCVEIRGESDGNWMATLMKGEKGEYRMEYRFRWYRDDKHHHSEDKRSFFTVQFNPEITSDAKAIEHGHEVYEVARKQSNSTISWELVRGARSTDEFVDALASMPGVRMKRFESEAEYRKEYGPDA